MPVNGKGVTQDIAATSQALLPPALCPSTAALSLLYVLGV
jgi:hypothetical protein